MSNRIKNNPRVAELLARAHECRIQAERLERELIETTLRERLLTQAEISRIVGVSRYCVSLWRRQFGLPRDETKVRK
jgi:hypothetical protein